MNFVGRLAEGVALAVRVPGMASDVSVAASAVVSIMSGFSSSSAVLVSSATGVSVAVSSAG